MTAYGKSPLEIMNYGGEHKMPVVKVLELVGQSHRDWQDAAQQAVTEASRKVPNISGVEVLNWTANVKEGRIVEYKANVKVAYLEQDTGVEE